MILPVFRYAINNRVNGIKYKSINFLFDDNEGKTIRLSHEILFYYFVVYLVFLFFYYYYFVYALNSIFCIVMYIEKTIKNNLKGDLNFVSCYNFPSMGFWKIAKHKTQYFRDNIKISMEIY